MIDRARPWPVILAATAARVAWAALSGVEPSADSRRYIRYAESILDGEFILHTYKPTGASLFLVAHWAVTGVSLVLPAITIALLSGLQLYLLHRIVRDASGSETAARAALLLLAVWPEHFLYVNLLNSDVLFGTAVLGGVALLASALRRDGGSALAMALASGAVIGLGHWVRPTAPVFIVAFALTLLARPRWALVRRGLAVAALGAGFLLLVAPIAVINKGMLGRYSINPAQTSGWSLLVGANPVSRGYTYTPDGELVRERMESVPRRPGEHEGDYLDRIARELAIERIRGNPGRTALLYVSHKPWRLWSSPSQLLDPIKFSRVGVLREPAEAYNRIWHMLALLVCGAFLLSRRPLGLSELAFALAAVGTTAAHVVVEVQPRYHHMFVPLLAILAGRWVASRLERRIPS